MKKTLIALAVAHIAAAALAAAPRRATTNDVAFGFRMGAGFPGDPNRSHPMSIEPGLMDPTNPIRQYGDPCLINSTANTYRGFIASDSAVTKLDGVLVRPYPVQQTTGGMNAALGAAVPPQVRAAIDVMNDGYIMVKCNNAAVNPPAKGGAVFVRVAATSGNLVQGGFHAADDGANAIQVSNARWNGPADADGVAELLIWKA